MFIKRLVLLIVFAFLIFASFVGCYDYIRDRRASRVVNFQSSYGTDVSVNEGNDTSVADVDAWTKEAIEFWSGLYPAWGKCLLDVSDRAWAFFYAEGYVLDEDGKQFGGLAYRPSLIVDICNGDKNAIREVFIHEMSHLYVCCCGAVCGDTEFEHRFFDRCHLLKESY